MFNFHKPYIHETFGRFSSAEEVQHFLELYEHPSAKPYIPIREWGIISGEYTLEDFIQEIAYGECALSIEGSDPMRFVRDIGATLTCRIRCCPDPHPSAKKWVLQEWRRNEHGLLERRKNFHTSASEKLVGFEVESLGIPDDWVNWWSEASAAFNNAALGNPSWIPQFVAIFIRFIKEELQIDVSEEDVMKNLIFVPIHVWMIQDKILQSLQLDGTYICRRYEGLYNRNRLLCCYWEMPAVSTLGHTLFKPDGYEDKNGRNISLWAESSSNDD